MNYKLFRKQLYEDVATNNSFGEKVAEVKQELKNGAGPKDVFDVVEDFSDGLAVVKLGDKYNFINNDGELLRENMWFNDVTWFNEGLAEVELNGKWNFINTNGEIVFDDLWFDYVRDFQDGFAKVYLGDEWYYLDTKGNLYDEDENLINNITENRQ